MKEQLQILGIMVGIILFAIGMFISYYILFFIIFLILTYVVSKFGMFARKEFIAEEKRYQDDVRKKEEEYLRKMKENAL